MDGRRNRRRQVPNRFGDFLSALPVGNDDSRRIEPVGGADQLPFQRVGNVFHRAIHGLPLSAGDENRGGLDHALRRAASGAGARGPFVASIAFRAEHVWVPLDSNLWRAWEVSCSRLSDAPPYYPE